MGFIVGLLGVDGCGKTTTGRLVAKRLRFSGYEATYHHEIDFFLLKPSFRLFAKLLRSDIAENIKENVLMDVDQSRRPYSDIYYILVWLDSFIAYLYFKLSEKIIIHDRWLYDFTTFFEHKNYKNRFVITLFTIFPRPDLLILLTVPPEVALLRKKDDIAHVNHDLKYYKNMGLKALRNAKRWNCDSIIDANKPVDEVADDILAILTKSHFKQHRNSTKMIAVKTPPEKHANGHPLISVVILNYNGWGLLEKCVRSVLDSDYKNLEVIVVDNASTDGSLENIREIIQENKNVKIIANKKNLGFALGNNVGINASRGKYVVLLNNDTEVSKDWLNGIARIMESDPDVGICEGKILVDNKVTYPGFSFNPYVGFAKMPEKDQGQYDYPHEIFSTKGVCVVLRRALIEKIGLLDSSLWITAEILDLCWRARLAGYKILYVPKSVIHHKARLGSGSYPMHVKINAAFHVTKNQTMILIKNLSSKNLLFKSLPIVILLRLFELVYLTIKRKKVLLLVKIKAHVWVFKNFKHIYRQRLWVQRYLRRVSDDEINKTLGKPNFLGVYRFYRKVIRMYA